MWLIEVIPAELPPDPPVPVPVCVLRHPEISGSIRLAIAMKNLYLCIEARGFPAARG